MTLTDVKTYTVAASSISLVELVELIPSIPNAITFMLQCTISVLTIIYLIKQIKHKQNGKRIDPKP